jgi:alternate signal-mediated exported protein
MRIDAKRHAAKAGATLWRGLRATVSFTIALIAALAIGVFGANALWNDSAPLPAEVGTGSFDMRIAGVSWAENTPGIEIADRHSGSSLTTVSEWVTVRGDVLVLSATIRTSVLGANLAADLVVNAPASLPAGMTGTMTLKDIEGTAIAGPVGLTEELRWTDVPVAEASDVTLEVTLVQGELTYVDPIAEPDPTSGAQTIGAFSIALDQVRGRVSGGDGA